MTALMCNNAMVLRLRWLVENDPEQKAYDKSIYMGHLAACPICRAYMDELNEQARTAQMPDMPEVEE